MFTQFTGQIHDAEGFGPPALGGVVNTRFAVFNFDDDDIDTGLQLFTLPYTAEIVGYTLNIVTAFDGTVDNTIDFGTTGDLTAFASGISGASTGQIQEGFDATAMFTALTESTPFLVTYNGTTPAAGQAWIAVFYVERASGV